jgi:hypothetical protein
MGHGIAQIAAQNGFKVTAVETKKEALDVGMGRYHLDILVVTKNSLDPPSESKDPSPRSLPRTSRMERSSPRSVVVIVHDVVIFN